MDKLTQEQKQDEIIKTIRALVAAYGNVENVLNALRHMGELPISQADKAIFKDLMQGYAECQKRGLA